MGQASVLARRILDCVKYAEGRGDRPEEAVLFADFAVRGVQGERGIPESWDTWQQQRGAACGDECTIDYSEVDLDEGSE